MNGDLRATRFGPRPRGNGSAARLPLCPAGSAGQMRRSDVSISTAMARRAKQRGQWREAKNDARSRTVRPQRGQFTYDIASPADRPAMELQLPELRARIRLAPARSQPHHRCSSSERSSLQPLAAVRIGKRPGFRGRPSDEAPHNDQYEIQRVEHVTPSRPAHPLLSRGTQAVRMVNKWDDIPYEDRPPRTERYRISPVEPTAVDLTSHNGSKPCPAR